MFDHGQQAIWKGSFSTVLFKMMNTDDATKRIKSKNHQSVLKKTPTNNKKKTQTNTTIILLTRNEKYFYHKK